MIIKKYKKNANFFYSLKKFAGKVSKVSETMDFLCMPMKHVSQMVPGEIEVHQVFALNQQMLHHLIIKYADTRNVFGFPFRIKSGSLY